METTPENSRHAKRGSHAATRRARLGRALLLTLASTIVPGTAHLSRGRRRTGLLLVSLLVLVVALAIVALTRPRQQLLHLALDPAWLLGIIIGAAVLALAWVVNIVWSYTVVRPGELSLAGKFLAGATVTVLCLLVCAPLVLAANFAQAQRDLVTGIFPNGDSSDPAAGSDEHAIPWHSGKRLNVLLIGGDADPSRPGVRTDVMVVASVDPDTGNTVLLSVPRNMQHVPMPFPALRKRFPEGFPDYLYGLWRYGVQHPKLVPGNSPPGSQRPGAHLLTETIEEVLGVPVDYYALVDLDGFEQLINALGGVWIDVQKPIPYGEHGQFVVKAGYRKLDGRDALWYSRSRLDSSDYDRMRRQRCMLGAIANQADPITVLRNFRELTHAAKRTVSTNIPRDLLPDMVTLAPRVKDGTITNFQFVPPVIETGDPDFAKIQRITRRVINESEAPPEPKRSSEPRQSVRAGTPAPGGTARATQSPRAQPPGPSATEKPEEPEAGPVSVTAACPRITEPDG